MMSRISSNNLFAHSMLRKMWLYIISLVVLMIAGPGRLLMQIDNLLMWNPSTVYQSAKSGNSNCDCRSLCFLQFQIPVFKK